MLGQLAPRPVDFWLYWIARRYSMVVGLGESAAMTEAHGPAFIDRDGHRGILRAAITDRTRAALSGAHAMPHARAHRARQPCAMSRRTTRGACVPERAIHRDCARRSQLGAARSSGYRTGSEGFAARWAPSVSWPRSVASE